MIDPPKRAGYRLNDDAECLYNDWQEIGGCSCHTGGAPCRSCHNEGHPISLEENDEAWELDEEVEDMARDNITDKSSPPKSEWFGFKYRVTPESSKLLQEAVFKDGGKWSASKTGVQLVDHPYFFVKVDGALSYCSYDEASYFERHHLPEKQPPQAVKVEPTKSFVVGKWYKCVDATSGTHALTEGNYYKCTWVSPHLPTAVGVDSNTMKDSRGWMISRFDINSESDYDPNTAHGKFVEDLKAAFPPFSKVVAKDVEESKLGTPKAILEAVNFVHDFKPNDFSITKEDVNMSNQNRVVSVKFFDDDAGLKAENSLVAEYQITTRVSDQMTISKVLLTGDVAGDIALHNGIRANTVDLHILKQTGNKVFLQPIDFEDLRVEVRQV